MIELVKSALLVFVVAGLQAASAVGAQDLPPAVANLVESTCLDCHNSAVQQGGLDLEAAPFDPSSRSPFATWVKVHDRVAAGEMPPPAGYGELDADQREPFIAEVADELRSANRAKQETWGRVQ